MRLCACGVEITKEGSLARRTLTSVESQLNSGTVSVAHEIPRPAGKNAGLRDDPRGDGAAVASLNGLQSSAHDRNGSIVRED
jgi:hypothetical protein